MSSSVASVLAERIAEVLAPPAMGELLVGFFSTTGKFAATTFDDLGDNPPDRFTADDLLATTLLDMRFAPAAVRAILNTQADDLGKLLTAVPGGVDLWSATDEDLRSAYDLWDALRAGGDLTGVGRTTTSKLMARKRPRLIPIVDSVVQRTLRFQKDSWVELRAALQSSNLPERIERLRPPGIGDSISTLRVLDAAVWMRHSQGREAKKARAAVGL